MNGRTVLRGRELENLILSLPPTVLVFLCDVGGNAVRFFAVVFSGNFPEIVRDKRGRQKNLVFSWDFQWFRGWDLGVLLLFCFYFDLCLCRFSPRKTSFFLPTLSFWGGFRERTLVCDSGSQGGYVLYTEDMPRADSPEYHLESWMPMLDLQTLEFCIPRMECRIPRVVR